MYPGWPVLPAPAQAEPHLVHLLEVPDSGAVGAVDLEAERALRADADPGRLQGADGPGRVGSGREPDQRRDVVVVLDLAHLAVLDHGEVRGRSHRQDGPLGVHGRQQRADLGDRRHDVLHEVDHVAEQVAERAAAGLLAAEPPGQGAVGFGGVAVEEHRAHVGDAAELAGRDQLADPFHRGDVPVVVADGGGDAGRPGRGGDLPGLAGVPAHRLLDPERLARPGRPRRRSRGAACSARRWTPRRRRDRRARRGSRCWPGRTPARRGRSRPGRRRCRPRARTWAGSSVRDRPAGPPGRRGCAACPSSPR